MKLASFATRRVTAIIGTGVLGAGLLGGMAFAATPSTGDLELATAPSGNVVTVGTEKADRAAKLKAVLDGLVDKGVITRAQADAILDAIAQHAGGDHDRTHLREFVGDVFKESVNYIGLPAEAVKAQVQAGKSLGQIAGQQPGKSRDGLVADLHAKAEARIKAAVDAGKLTTEQATALRTKVDEAIVKIVDHEGAPRRDKTTPNAPAKPAAPTAKPTQ
jgi:polyhydroxyalkanoate synthesis regulator phasin